MLAAALAKLLADLPELKSHAQPGDVIEAADHVLRHELNIDTDRIIEFPADEIIRFLRSEMGIKNDHLEQLADILFSLTDCSGKSKNLLGKCLQIYEYLEKNDATYSLDRHFRIEAIKSLL